MTREQRTAAIRTLERLKVLLPLFGALTVRKVIEAGDAVIDAVGLNPWCLNEGLAEGHERVSLPVTGADLDDVLAILAQPEPDHAALAARLEDRSETCADDALAVLLREAGTALRGEGE